MASPFKTSWISIGSVINKNITFHDSRLVRAADGQSPSAASCWNSSEAYLMGIFSTGAASTRRLRRPGCKWCAPGYLRSQPDNEPGHPEVELDALRGWLPCQRYSDNVSEDVDGVVMVGVCWNKADRSARCTS